jgi:hypothetical protein
MHAFARAMNATNSVHVNSVRCLIEITKLLPVAGRDSLVVKLEETLNATATANSALEDLFRTIGQNEVENGGD